MTLSLILAIGFLQPSYGLHFPQPQVNLGELRSHVACTHRFEFTNTSRETIEILGVEPSCGCVAAKIAQRRISSGEKGTITLDIKPTTQATGPHSWYAKVIYRDGQRQETVQLHLQALVRREVSVEPAVIVWTGAGSREVTITDLRDPPLAVTGLHVTSLLMRAQLASSEKGVTRVVLQGGSAIPPGRHDEMLWIYTSDPVYGQLQIPVTLIGQERPAITVTPGEVRLQVVEGQPLPSTLVRLRPAGQKAVMVQSATADDPAITCTFAHGPFNEATLKIQVDAARMVGGELTSTVRIQIREPVEQVLTIPVRVSR